MEVAPCPILLESHIAGKLPIAPPKPYEGFPLYAHPLGYWSKTIRGRIHNFGRWGRIVNGKIERIEGDGWNEALEKYQEQRDDLQAGRTRRMNDDELTVADLCNRFLTAKKRKLDAGEIGPRMFGEYKDTTARLVSAFGGRRQVDDLAADDFEALRAELAKQYGPVRLGNEITRIKSVFKYAADNALLDRRVRFGSEFKKPGKAVLRRHKATNGQNMMEADEIRRLLKAAPVHLRAMLLLMLNCGFGPTDCATLPTNAVNVETAWIDYPRPKTGIPRRCPLWPETASALRASIAARPRTRQGGAEHLVFITSRGRQWISKNSAWPLTAAICALMKTASVHKKGQGPYTMRHVFRTIADRALDRVAIDLIIGQADPSMGAHYRERVDDSRLLAVVEYVRAWLWPKPTDDRTTPADETAGNEQLHGFETEPAKPKRRRKEASTEQQYERPALRLYVG